MTNFAHFCVICIKISLNLFYEINFFQILSLEDKIRILSIFVPSPPYSKSHRTLINTKTAGDIPGYLVFQNGGSVCLAAFNVMAVAFVVSG